MNRASLVRNLQRNLEQRLLFAFKRAVIRKDRPESDAVDIGLWLVHRVNPLCINNIVITVVDAN